MKNLLAAIGILSVVGIIVIAVAGDRIKPLLEKKRDEYAECYGDNSDMFDW